MAAVEIPSLLSSITYLISAFDYINIHKALWLHHKLCYDLILLYFIIRASFVLWLCRYVIHNQRKKEILKSTLALV